MNHHNLIDTGQQRPRASFFVPGIGHSSIKQTERYVHLNPKKLLEAVSLLNKGNDIGCNITNEIVLDSS